MRFVLITVMHCSCLSLMLSQRNTGRRTLHCKSYEFLKMAWLFDYLKMKFLEKVSSQFLRTAYLFVLLEQKSSLTHFNLSIIH